MVEQPQNLIALYCGRTLDDMRQMNGSGHWKVGEKSLQKAEYVLFIRNRNQSYSAKDVAHGTAFMLAKIDGTFSPSEAIAPEFAGKNRKIIHLTQYAFVHFENAWKILTGARGLNPVVYLNAEKVFQQMEIQPEILAWHDF